MMDEEVESQDTLIDKIVSFPGPVCTVSNLRACASSKTRVCQEIEPMNNEH